jgi:hypothetical protein
MVGMIGLVMPANDQASYIAFAKFVVMLNCKVENDRTLE